MATRDEKTVRQFIELEMQLVEVRRLFDSISEKLAESIGIMGLPVNKSQIKAMSALTPDDRLTMGEFCKLAGVKMPMMTEVVNKFVAEGVLERSRDTDDRRVVRVGLTDQGKRTMAKIVERRAEGMASLFGSLSAVEQKQLGESLRTLRRILGKIVENSHNN